MFFRSAMIYRLGKSVDFSSLEEQLQNHKARPCGDNEMSTIGFAPPIGSGDDAVLAHICSDSILIRMMTEDRILPSSVVNDALQAKIKAMEARDDRVIYKSERADLKDAIVREMIPRAFIKKASTFALIMPKQSLIIVDGTPSRAEAILCLLRMCMGSLKARPLITKSRPSLVMTNWLSIGNMPKKFAAGRDYDLKDYGDEGGAVRCVNQDIDSVEIQLHLSSGKYVNRLALNWDRQFSFMLNEKLQVSRIKFDGLLQSQAEEDGGESHALVQEATVIIMAKAFSDFVPFLAESFGGEEVPEDEE